MLWNAGLLPILCKSITDSDIDYRYAFKKKKIILALPTPILPVSYRWYQCRYFYRFFFRLQEWPSSAKIVNTLGKLRDYLIISAKAKQCNDLFLPNLALLADVAPKEPYVEPHTREVDRKFGID